VKFVQVKSSTFLEEDHLYGYSRELAVDFVQVKSLTFLEENHNPGRAEIAMETMNGLFCLAMNELVI